MKINSKFNVVTETRGEMELLETSINTQQTQYEKDRESAQEDGDEEAAEELTDKINILDSMRIALFKALRYER